MNDVLVRLIKALLDYVRRVDSALQADASRHVLSRWLFLRMLGFVYLAAFASLWCQVDGLIGSQGILPAAEYLRLARDQLGLERYWLLPTLCWISSSDGFLNFLAGSGVACSLLLILNVAPIPVLAVLWALYLSLCTVARDFLSFQWDILLLESGFLAIFLAPWSGRLRNESPPSWIALWLFRWLLFRLMFMSGAVKLLSEDAAWWNLTALTFHYETQPLPTWIGWFVHQAPAGFHKFACGVMFGLELAVPLLIFGGRRLRQIASGAFAGLMLLISITGNYCFFNLLTAALCVLLVDDPFLKRFYPRGWPDPLGGAKESSSAPVYRRAPAAFLGLALLFLSGTQMLARLTSAEHIPGIVRQSWQWASPFRSVNTYGLFAVMTTTRPEIVVEGSHDGMRWEAYEFKWKPGDLKQRPRFVAPHQPRLDWQMWFAALGSYQSNPWFINFLACLLQGSPDVVALLERNPFPEGPPKRVRAILYEYRFTDAETRAATGDWWRREYKGLYCPEITLRRE